EREMLRLNALATCLCEEVKRVLQSVDSIHDYVHAYLYKQDAIYARDFDAKVSNLRTQIEEELSNNPGLNIKRKSKKISQGDGITNTTAANSNCNSDNGNDNKQAIERLLAKRLHNNRMDTLITMIEILFIRRNAPVLRSNINGEGMLFLQFVCAKGPLSGNSTRSYENWGDGKGVLRLRGMDSNANEFSKYSSQSDEEDAMLETHKDKTKHLVVVVSPPNETSVSCEVRELISPPSLQPLKIAEDSQKIDDTGNAIEQQETPRPKVLEIEIEKCDQDEQVTITQHKKKKNQKKNQLIWPVCVQILYDIVGTHKNKVSAMVSHTNGQLIVSADEHGQIRFWKVHRQRKWVKPIK
ncbi:hypothetical protein RFI_18189, partial [Reticulomyxa filosa]